MNYSEDKTYGRKIIRSNGKKYQRRLFASWGVCFLIGFLIGCILMSGIVHIFTCTKTVNAKVVEPIVVPTYEPTAVETVSACPVKETNIRSLGVYKLTAYCACVNCCGKTDGITASGVKAIEGITIAADTNILPFGTRIIIDGDVHEYIVQDRGGAINGNRIDIYFDSHQKALEFGVQYKEIFIKKEGEMV